MRFNENGLKAYLQPIAAIENSRIYGYEVLGRYSENGETNSLGAFFADESVSQYEKVEVDRIIRRRGMEEFAANAQAGQYIFINMSLCWLDAYAANPDDMPTLRFARELGIDFSRIVIEISEHDFSERTSRYSIPIAYYKSLGIRIAIDDYGTENSCISRLAELCPDIVKIDMDIVQKSESCTHYSAYMRCITDLCSTLGIEVIYEGMENTAQLSRCINSGGRFCQGFLLAKPAPSVNDCDLKSKYITECLYGFIILRAESDGKSRKLIDILDCFTDSLLDSDIAKLTCDALDESVIRIADTVPCELVRVFFCNKFGFQISSNIRLGSVIEVEPARGENWAWRGYFKNAIRSIGNTDKSYISHAYRDISEKCRIYTYVRDLGSNVYIFIDIDSSAIDEQ